MVPLAVVLRIASARLRVAPQSLYLWAVRAPVLIASLLLAACTGGGDHRSNPASRAVSSAAPRGADALLLRVPRGGGAARVVKYPDVDSTVWTANDEAPALDRALAFDPDAGEISAVDVHGRPVWVDLRLGTVTQPERADVHGFKSISGSDIFGVGADGAVVRFAPAGNWVFHPPQPARVVFPQSGGTLLILGGHGDSAKLWRVHPPATRVLDSLAVPNATGGAGAPLGDRVYLAVPKHTLVAVRTTRTLALGPRIEFPHSILSIETTPSGDRFYVVADSENTMYVVDRYQDRITAHIALPGRPRELRVDPYGRYVLVRSAGADSVWIVAVGTDRVIGTLQSRWMGDVPFVAPDGAIAVSDGRDLIFVDGTTMHETRRVDGGAWEFWYPFVWDGLRPRSAALDQPVAFPSESDTSIRTRAPAPAETTSAPTRPTAADSAKLGFTVSFAVLLDPVKARDAASKITVNGQPARVVTGMSNGIAVYRVILGPFPTREEADRAGRASGQSYYVYAGSP